MFIFMTELPCIFSYSDYRLYLKDYYELSKARNKAFSFRYLSMKAEINSAPFYKFIIEGKTNLTKATIVKTCIALKLKPEEATYFENLVFFNQAKTLKEKNVHFARLIESRKGMDFKKIADSEYDYFSQWYHVIIRELAVITDFKDDFSLLAKKISPQITPRQARDSVELLLRLGFLKKEDGRYIQAEPVLTTGKDIRNHQIMNFQIEMLKIAIEAYERHARETVMMSSTTLSISQKSFDMMKDRIRAFRAQLLEMARSDEKPDKVYQLNLNFFPMNK